MRRRDKSPILRGRGAGAPEGEGGGKDPPVLVHLVILPTLLTGLRGRTVGALGRVCLMRAGTCQTLKRGMWAWSALRVAGGGGTGVVPSGVGDRVVHWCSVECGGQTGGSHDTG